MSGKFFFGLCTFLVFLSFKTPDLPLQKIQMDYIRANRLYSGSDNNAAADSICMKAFKEVIAALDRIPRSGMSDSLMFQSNYKLGILKEEYKDYAGAIGSYLRAISYSTDASDRFRMYTLAGAGYYNLNNFDSATYFLLGADQMPGTPGSTEDRVRLYNTLGVLYYDNGNYLQSKNYFTQALRLIEKKGQDNYLKVYIRLNLATCSYKLGLFDQTLSIYRKLEQEHLLPDAVFLNMGNAYSGLQQYEEALTAFRKVKISSEPGVLNEMAKNAIKTGNTDSALAWLRLYQKEKKSLRTNTMDDGVNELYFGELELALDHPEGALQHLQEALIRFSRSFLNTDIRKNPENFTGSFAYYRLFEVLATKASAWELMYKKTSSGKDLRSALDSYQTSISLLSYIERSYEMDDAKILLKQKSGELYSKAIDVCLRLNLIFPRENFLETAFLITEKNKASVMGAQIREMNLLRSAGRGNELASEERNIKYNIARLNAKMDEGGDAHSLENISDEKAAYETRLVILRRKMDENKQFYSLKYADDFPSVKQLQEKMGGDQVLISFFNEPEKIDIFFLSKSDLRHIQLDSAASIIRNIRSWMDILQSAESGKHARNVLLRKSIFEKLMKPVLNQAGDKGEWIIVPDGLFFLLPFESLPADDTGNPVIEKHAVSYEFSAGFILENKSRFLKAETPNATISFAPFSQQGANLDSEGMGKFEKLPFSKDETNGLEGVRFMNQQATKEQFIHNQNLFPIIHLATHAMTDLENSSASYISFYPSAGNRTDDFLFLDEIYSLRMDSCQMIVISACETGKGALVRNEGVMSFARAFLYAGCPSTINTLWKADDRSTAEILKKFYFYLADGDSKAKALQKAKLDFIHNNPIRRNPSYWSHIIITGDAGPVYKKKQPWYGVVLGMSFGTMLFFLNRKMKGKKPKSLKADLDFK